MNIRTLIFGFFALQFVSGSALAYSELEAEFGYNRSIYGENRQSKNTLRSYSGSFAVYFLGATAIELNYSQNDEEDIDNSIIGISGYDLSVISQMATIESFNYGIGLRQALASRGSAIVPMISLGYAKQFIYSQSTTTYRIDSSGERFVIYSDLQKYREDSVFGAFSLLIHLTKRISVKGSVKTLIPAFETNKIKDDLRYTVGISWIL